MAEGAPLLREYGVKSPIEGSNPSLSARYGKARLARVFSYLAERALRSWTKKHKVGNYAATRTKFGKPQMSDRTGLWFEPSEASS